MKRLKEECDLQFKNIIMMTPSYTKNLYDHQTTNYAILSTQYSNLSREHSFLKKCYVSTLAQKNEYVNERIKLRNAIRECYVVLNRITAELSTVETDPSEAMSNQNAFVFSKVILRMAFWFGIK